MLAAACCRWPPSPARDAAVRAAAAAIDWARFERVVARQRVAGLVDPALREAAVAVPEPVAAAIARNARQTVHRNLLAASETVRLARLIAAAGYPVLAVKGAVLGAQAYGSVAFKHSKDIDLLILPRDHEAVLALLEADAYRLIAPAETLDAAQRAVLARYGKDASLIHRSSHVQVELHWRLFVNTTLLPGLTAASPTQTVELASGMTVPTLALPDLYAYLVMHGATDGWSRMKWIADVNALLAPLDAAAVLALHGHAVRLGAGAASAQALLLMHELFALPLAPDVAVALRARRRVRWLVAGAYRLMAARDGHTEIADWRGGQMLALAMHLLLGRGPGNVWQIARSILYMQSDMYRSRIPPSLYVFYPLVRIPQWVIQRIAGIGTTTSVRGRSATVGTESP